LFQKSSFKKFIPKNFITGKLEVKDKRVISKLGACVKKLRGAVRKAHVYPIFTLLGSLSYTLRTKR